jgi:molybdopterin/thiamine biosynthesis adenylyltransferase
MLIIMNNRQRHPRLRATTIATSPEKFYETFADRNLGILSAEQQRIISKTRVAQAGTGGTSDVVLTLSQLGFQHFTLADPDIFELSNFNRQIGADVASLGKKKVDRTRDLVLAVNPWAEISTLPEGVTKDNINSFLKNVQILIETVDSQAAQIKLKLIDEALARKIPVFTSPSPGWGAILLFFDPRGGCPSMTELVGAAPSERFNGYANDDLGFRWALYFNRVNYLFMPHNDGPPEGVVPKIYASRSAPPCISPACRLRAALLSSAVLKWLFHKEKLVSAPSVVHYDLFSDTVSVIKRTMQDYRRGLEQVDQAFIDKWEPQFKSSAIVIDRDGSEQTGNSDKSFLPA